MLRHLTLIFPVFLFNHWYDILGNKYLEQINDDKNDTVIYEVRRFLELLVKITLLF